MLNSKMKRSMAWIMSAAVIMSAAPVSAADFTAEADVEVTAEAADTGAEENTDAPEAEVEEDGGFGSGEMISEENTAEAGSDETGLADEDNTGDESADFMDGFSDGSAEEESADVSEGFIDEGMSTEELVEAFSGAADNQAPYSSVDKLENGTYTVTANVYVPGELNKVLVGTNAFLANPKYPFGSGADKGKPTTPVYYNAELNVKDGDVTVTLELKNPVFQALQINDGSNVTVVDRTYNEELSNSEIHTKYGKKIQTITFKLNDYSGMYDLGDCKEFASILYTEGNSATEADAVWDVPLKLAVDFQEIGKQETPVVSYFLNPELQVALVTNKALPEGTTEDMREITADSEGEDGKMYQEFDTFFKENATNANNYGFRAFYIGLKDANGNPISNIEQYKPTFYTQAGGFFPAFDGQCGQAMARIENGKLTTNIVHGGVGDAENDLAVFETEDGVWDYTFSYESGSFSGGYVFVYDKEAAIPFKYHVEDTDTGIAMNYYGVSGSGLELPQEEEANDYYRIKTAKNKRGIGDQELESQLKEKSGYQKLYYNTYQMGMYSLATDPSTDDILYLAFSDQKVDVELPTDGLTDFEIYEIVYDKSDSSYTSVEQITDYTVTDGKAVFYVVKGGLSSKRKRIAQRLYGSVVADDYEGSRAGSIIQYYAIVSEGAIAEKPSVSDTVFTYDGTEKTLIPENQYYTVTGDVSKTLPGTYHVTVTLKEGYAWTDGTTDPIEFDWIIKALQTEKPVAISGLTYNGESQTGVKAGTGYNLAGTYTAKDAGTYNAKVLLADGYEWSDGTKDALTLTWSIAKKAIAKPSAVKALVYNGKSQTGVTAGEGYTVTSNTQTDAGDYTAVAALDKNYVWADGTTDSAKVAWSIAKKTVAKPAAAANLVYTGKAQTGVTAGEGYTVTGNTQTNAGTYAAVATLDKNHAWTDGTTAPATVQWTIAKAAQNVTAKTASKSYKIATVKKKAQSFTIGAAANGTLTYKVTATPSKKAAKYLTVTKNGKVTVKKGAPAGTYTITVSAAETANNQAASKEVTVKVNKTSQKVSAKVSSKTIKSKQIAKKNATFTIGAKGKGKLIYKVTSTPKNGAKYISVNKNGKVTVKKKAPKGTYKITVTAAGNATYAKATKTITVKVK